MIDALGYRSCMETLDAWNYLVQIYTPLTLCRSRIEYICLAMLRPVEVG